MTRKYFIQLLAMLAMLINGKNSLSAAQATLGKQGLDALHQTALLHRSKSSNSKRFKHNIQLQVTDFFGVPVENTQFWITVDVVKNGDEVTLHLPTINFQIGQCAAIDPECGLVPPFGYVVTNEGFLPKNCRPTSLTPVSIVAAAENGLVQTGSFADSSPVPPPGFIVQVTNAGGIHIQQAESPQNVITTGPQIVAPCSITYLAGKKKEICRNFRLSQGEIDVTQLTGATPHGTPAGDNIRDSHINDAFEDTVVWAWTDNHNVDKTANILNVFVVVGKVDRKGHLKFGKPIQLTNLPVNTIAWDTSVAINRTDKSNIIVSYKTISYDFTDTFFDGNISDTVDCRAVSFDGGKTWGGVYDGVTSLTYNGPLNIQPPGGEGSGDYPGVGADQFGNFWIGTTNFSDGAGNLVNVPYLLISSDKGVTWNLAFTSPPVANPQPPAGAGGTNGDQYDYPHLCFGGSGTGQYGIWYYSDYIVNANILGDLYPCVTFIPITGLGSYGSATTTFLNGFPNSIGTPTITASLDGRFWAMGNSNIASYLYDLPVVSLFKSPGTIDQNYAGPWLNGFLSSLSFLGLYPVKSVPFFGYFLSVQGLIYDEGREALYALYAANFPELSQDMRLYFSISRNNGLTWSRPYDISTTAFANRGFDSMALDPTSGNLFFGWYDGRNDKTQTKIQYYGAMIKSRDLDRLVRKIPLSDPLFVIPSQGSPLPPDAGNGG